MDDNTQQANIATTIGGQMQAATAHVNVKQEFIVITEDRLWRRLTEWKDRLDTHGKWIAPLSILASLLFCFVTSTFHDALDVPQDTWRALAMVGIAASLIWLCYTVYKRVRAALSKSSSIDEVIKVLKQGATSVTTTGRSGSPPSSPSTTSDRTRTTDAEA